MVLVPFDSSRNSLSNDILIQLHNPHMAILWLKIRLLAIKMLLWPRHNFVKN